MMGATLHVVNMSQQSDMSDLLGGFRPVDVRVLAAPLREKFEAVFTQACHVMAGGHGKARMGWLSTVVSHPRRRRSPRRPMRSFCKRSTKRTRTRTGSGSSCCSAQPSRWPRRSSPSTV
jgi:hypothetical protein